MRIYKNENVTVEVYEKTAKSYGINVKVDNVLWNEHTKMFHTFDKVKYMVVEIGTTIHDGKKYVMSFFKNEKPKILSNEEMNTSNYIHEKTVVIDLKNVTNEKTKSKKKESEVEELARYWGKKLLPPNFGTGKR